MVILGIDPGSQVAGFGVLRTLGDSIEVVDYGVIGKAKGLPFSVRLEHLGRELRKLFGKFTPNCAVIEQVFLGKNVNSAFRLGHARGVCLYESVLGGAEVVEYSTRVVKKGVTGRGNADKEEVQIALSRLLNLTQKMPLDASDALALAYYHVLRLAAREKLLRQTLRETQVPKCQEGVDGDRLS